MTINDTSSYRLNLSKPEEIKQIKPEPLRHHMNLYIPHITEMTKPKLKVKTKALTTQCEKKMISFFPLSI